MLNLLNNLYMNLNKQMLLNQLSYHRFLQDKEGKKKH
jgi:hypothetical protein